MAGLEITLEPNEWIVATREDLPVGPPAHWSSALLLLQRDGHWGLQAIHNRTFVKLAYEEALGVDGIPVAIVVPNCPRCQATMKLVTGRHGAFFGCPGYPACDGVRKVHEYFRTEPME